MSQLPDPVRERLSQWKVFGAEHAPLPAQATVDVAIIGSGAGGGITAETAGAGRPVGAGHRGRPAAQQPRLQAARERGLPAALPGGRSRKTADKAINILQGRCVGGSTTVNWTSSFRTPTGTLAFWQRRSAWQGFDPEAMAPWFERAEQRLSISDWRRRPQPQQRACWHAARRSASPAGRIRRNVKGCWNLGSCGMGCPTNAKQSMLVTTLPAALDAGARSTCRRA
jgi:choline dehydrogenase-like flavoprotein